MRKSYDKAGEGVGRKKKVVSGDKERRKDGGMIRNEWG